MATSVTTSGMYLGSAGAMWIMPSVVRIAGAGGLLKLIACLGMSWSILWFFVGGKVQPKQENVLPLSHHSKISARATPSHPSTPWRKIATSVAVWAIIVNNFTFHYAVYVVMNWLPTYFNDLIKAELSAIGVIKGLPYVLMFLFSITGVDSSTGPPLSLGVV